MIRWRRPTSKPKRCMSSTVKFPRVAKEVGMDQCLDGHIGEERLVGGNEAVVNVAVVDEVDLGVVRQGVM